MKRIIHITLLTLALAVLAGCAHKAEVSPESALYKQYAGRQGLSVAQVCGFRLNDTVRVDVVLLQAEGEQEWQQLKEEFKITGNDGMESWLGDTLQPAQRVKWYGTPVLRVVASHSRHTMAFYRLDTECQYDALLDYQLGEMKNNK